ncbi:hypothetical protein [Streptomyces sp. NPDC008137]|uniref:hypothetical protein n=1 Tax=Streptomyces sp. NPDC008137 TaxID=3364813 RepID=UPI0036EA03FF
MTTTAPQPHPSDEQLTKALDTVNHWSRAALCTLARHGAALRRDHPERALHVLDTLAPWPPYKGGQFLFDLMEWEDFMLDGDPPPMLPLTQALDIAGRPLRWLRTAVAHIISTSAGTRTPDDRPGPQDLPELVSSRYLYADLVLGTWRAGDLLLQASGQTETLLGHNPH